MKTGDCFHCLMSLFKTSFFFIICIYFLYGSSNDSWQQFVHYTMNVKLVPESHEMRGTSHIIYVNNSPDDLDRIYLHLYPNAFQEGSVKYREFQQKYGRLGRIGPMLKDITPYKAEISIHSFTVTMGNNQISELFEIDDTILMASLPEPLVTGDSLIINIDWTHHVGEQIERAGYVDDQYNAAQWYPKMVVFDEKGWHNDPFHAEGEFYGEFGTFDVTIDLPKNYIIGATGVVISGDPGWKKVEVDTSQKFDEWLKKYQKNKTDADSSARRIITFHAENVHDFAWIASPAFLYEHGSWNGIDVHVLYNESNGEKWTKVVRERSERALEWLSTKFGMYPYPQVTTTDRIKGGGMEYPMLIMNGSDSEGLVVHEIGHIWFYGILANNELDDAWLDEGFTTFQTRWYLENRYPPTGHDFSLSHYKNYQKKWWRYARRLDGAQWSAIRFATSGFDEPISRSSYLFGSGSSYRQNAYTKPSLMLVELKYILGDSVFHKALQAYFSRWNLQHVNEEKFITTVEEVSGQDLGWFFNPWLHDTAFLDYAVTGWKKKQLENGNWEVSLDIRQKGDRFLPVKIHSILKNGKVYETWYKNHLWRFKDTFVFTVPYNPEKIVLDPDGQTVDLDRRNNQTGGLKHEWLFSWPGMFYKPRDAYVVRWFPLLYYHELDGYMPGLHLSRDYGHWEGTDLKLNYGLESQKLSWSVFLWRKPVHSTSGVWWDLYGYNQIAIDQFTVRIHGQWNKKYSVPPFHSWTFGFFHSNAKDTSRTDLFDPGVIRTVFGRYKIQVGSKSAGLDMTIAPDDVSDWSFSRITVTMNAEFSAKKFGMLDRMTIGKIWSGDEGVPNQERYTIERAGSGDIFSKPYLRDESSFYGIPELRSHYHLAGDANLRGFFGKGYAGTEAIITNTAEVYYSQSLFGINVKFAGFVDAGFLWGSQFIQGDNGFDGDFLANAGLGIRLKKNWFGKSFYLRVDSPFWLNITNEDEDSIDFSRWVFSFSKGI